MIRLVFAFCLMACAAFAVEPDEVLDDPALEARARAISADVRCVVCQNEPIDSSSAGVARDLRVIIRERLVAGDSDQEVFDYLVLRYGDFVLFDPPWKPSTYALWIGPFVILALGFLATFYALWSRRGAAAPTLSKAEEDRVKRMLDDET